ncbi:MAG: hypothetical protein CMI02_13725 [Oceanospirillaceae bacterium]|nr:hypothetical protein [Oceanospirillaceae bacterium]
MFLGQRFARELDLYRAITCFKSALYLHPDPTGARYAELEYDIILAYFLGGKYQEVIETFECSSLVTAGPGFPAFPDLLIMLHEAYTRDGRCDRAEGIMELIQRYSPETAEDLTLQQAVVDGNVACARSLASAHPKSATILPCLDTYCCCAKSARKAQTLNAILPGAGYYYVGQRSSAMTSFLLNTLFTAAAWYFFDEGNIAAGIITTSLEAGWYFGGINGAGLAAKQYNEYLWEGCGKETLVRHRLFPVLMLEHSF